MFNLIIRKKELIFNVIFVCFIFVFSFPNIEPDYNIGIDAPFNWAYNYLWNNDYNTLTELIYTYGPLGFLKKPIVTETSNTVLIALLFYSSIKLIFLFSLLHLGKRKHKLLVYILIFIIAYFVNIDTLLVGLSIISAVFLIEKKALIYFGLLMLVALTGLYIKFSIGIMCLSVVLVSLIWLIYQKWRLISFLYLSFISLGLIVLTNLIIGNDLFFIFNYLKNGYMITKGYSSSLSLHPNNNWLALSLFIITIFIYPLLKQHVSFVYLLLLLPLFLMWKQALVREDFSHYQQLLDFIILFWGLIILLSTKYNKKRYYLIPLISILALHVNAKNVINYNGSYSKNVAGINKLTPFLLSFKEHTLEYHEISLRNTSINSLENEAKAIIKNKTIDVYPWDLSYIAINKLNWQPRTTLQSIGISGWEDKKSSENFTKKNGPQFVLFHSVKDTSKNKLGAIDYRYLLNLEPLTITQIFTHYNICYSNEQYTLFRKNNSPNFNSPSISTGSKVIWNEWILCPQIKNSILKAQLITHQTFLGNSIQFLYKDIPYYIDYQLSSGKILTFRFIPSIAENGLWVNPIITSFEKENAQQNVIKIRFRTDYKYRVEETINLQWEVYKKTHSNGSTLFHYKQ